MKKLVSSVVLALSATLVGGMFFGTVPVADAGENCYNCEKKSGGPDQCKQGSGGDTSDRRKKCEAAGCKIAGTASCSTAANTKVIDP
jgi:hypothetical protein